MTSTVRRRARIQRAARTYSIPALVATLLGLFVQNLVRPAQASPPVSDLSAEYVRRLFIVEELTARNAKEIADLRVSTLEKLVLIEKAVSRIEGKLEK